MQSKQIWPAPISEMEETRLREALRTLEMYTILPRIPMARPPTGYEGRTMTSLPGHVMVYNDAEGMEGVEIETPEGMRISFESSMALNRFLGEMNISTAERHALQAIDERARPVRHRWRDRRTSV